MRGGLYAEGTNRTVWKFGPLFTQANVIEMPKGAQILNVGFQLHGMAPYTKEDLFLWALVDPTAVEKEQRRFGVVPTGRDSLPHFDGCAYRYIGTAHMSHGLVFHAFEAVDRTKALLESILQ